MKLLAVLKPGEDGWIVANVPALKGCYSQGRTREEALENIREAAELWIETSNEMQLQSMANNSEAVEIAVA